MSYEEEDWDQPDLEYLKQLEIKEQKIKEQKRIEEEKSQQFYKKYKWDKIFDNFKKIGISEIDFNIIKRLVYEYKIINFKQLFYTKFIDPKSYFTKFVDIYHCLYKKETEMFFRVLVGIFAYKTIDYNHNMAIYWEKTSEEVVDFFKLLNNFLSNNFFYELTCSIIKNNVYFMNYQQKEDYFFYLYSNFDIELKNLRYKYF